MNNNQLQQWEKRVILTKYIYGQLIKQDSILDIKKEFSENFLNIDAKFVEILEYCFDNKNEIIKILSSYISDKWTFDRLNLVDQAILLEAYSEYQVLKTDKSILIDQAIITSKKYSDAISFQFINAILDRVL